MPVPDGPARRTGHRSGNSSHTTLKKPGHERGSARVRLFSPSNRMWRVGLPQKWMDVRLVSAAPLGVWRVSFGLLMLLHIGRLHVHGMYARSVLHPAFHFRYRIFDWELAPPLPTTNVGAYLHLLFMGASALGIALGVLTRCCALAFALAYSAFVLSERSIFNNHYYLYAILALLIALVGADQAVTLPRAWQSVTMRSSSLQPPTVAAWRRDLLRMQLCIVYAYAGVAKLNSDWCAP